VRIILFCLATLATLLVGCKDEPTTNYDKGLFELNLDANTQQLYLRIPKSTSEYIYYTSLARGLGSNDIGADRGLLGDTKIVSFKQVGNKLHLIEHNTKYRATSANQAENQAVAEAFPDYILWSFELIESTANTWQVDATDFALRDSMQISDWLSGMNQGSFSPVAERSFVYAPRTKTFPDNTEIEAVITFEGSGAGRYLKDVVANESGFSLHLHHSFVRLPDDGFEPRAYDPQSGFFAIGWQDYTRALNESLDIKLIPRHRLAKKSPDEAVSEAIEPIVYYLDPGAPEPVKTALLEGGQWWDQAFDNIGYRNAFRIEILPEGADPMDVRYNVINWVHRATRGWSYGASIIDPRTGEILKGHVTLGSLRVRQDLAIAQAILNDTDAQAAEDMALARIRQLSAHEIGHTLGIAHNFAASAHDRASVMDYPHPLFTLKDGEVSLNDAYAEGIGEWDKLVVAYGYGDEPVAALAALNTTPIGYVSDQHARPSGAAIAEGHLWDNGKNPSTELERLVELRKLAIHNLSERVLRSSDINARFDQLLVPIYNLQRFQIEAVARQIGGVNYQSKTKGHSTAVTPVTLAEQSRALEAFTHAITAETLLLPEHIQAQLLPQATGYYRNRESSPSQMGELMDNYAMAEALVRHSLSKLLSPARLNRAALPQHLSIAEISTGLFSQLITANPDRSRLGLMQHRISIITLDELGKALSNKRLSEEAKTQLWDALNQQHSQWPENDTAEAKRIANRLQKLVGTMPSASEEQVIPPGSPI